ncbi:MAG: hypothetical protein EPO51_26590 [Phenylobacterium sp.]|uniref:DUF6265 family protein n=1 Tax=Phenylobacterium sp. TaxID=1871053 RepID=UPI0012116C41|nr:DUF6265 family protein [Phenylobacterium sp.]TAJ68461.1 MAG: hypothetical protein EPO51_26590 [Phenylobacterium sp.]
MRIALALIALATATAARAAPADDVTRLSWMAGSWVEEKDGVTTRETWLPPLGGVMAGAGQTNAGTRPPRVEHMKIAAESGGATYTAVIPGQAPTPFVLLPGKDGEAVFENRAHDFPQRVIYRRCGEDLCARIEGILRGRPASESWRYHPLR